MKNFNIYGNTSDGNMLQDLSLGLLANSGYSKEPRTFGEILAASFASADAQRQKRQESELAKAKLGMELRKLQQNRFGSLPQGYMYNEETGQATKVPGLENIDPSRGQGGVLEWAYNQSKVDPNFTNFINKYNYDKSNSAAQGKNVSDLNYAPKIAEEKQIGKERGSTKVLLNSLESKMPQLQQTVDRLSELGKTATYTKAGQAVNLGRKELGLDTTAAAEARAEYISVVNNEILPLMRDTFGAQFTQKEGESLRDTLGNPNATPQEKDAILRSFIYSKTQQIKSLRDEVSPKESIATGASVTPSRNIKDFSNEELMRQLNGQ